MSDGREALVWAASLLTSMQLVRPPSAAGMGAYRVACNFCGEDRGHADGYCLVPAAEEWLVRYGRNVLEEGLLDDVRPIVAWLASHGTEEYPGDYYGITCRVCGQETDGRHIKARDGEGHETGCPLPELRAWNAAHGRA